MNLRTVLLPLLLLAAPAAAEEQIQFACGDREPPTNERMIHIYQFRFVVAGDKLVVTGVGIRGESTHEVPIVEMTNEKIVAKVVHDFDESVYTIDRVRGTFDVRLASSPPGGRPFECWRTPTAF